jgi:stage II sporulation protein AA (anti-sigma F factor antagonist)
MIEVFSIREDGDLAVVYLLSELNMPSVLSIKTQLKNLATEKRTNRFVINFDKLNYINSMMIGAFIGIQKLFHGYGCDLVLCNVKPNIKLIFDLIGASRLFKIYDTEVKALSELTTMAAISCN